jgi:hypothetical protein
MRNARTLSRKEERLTTRAQRTSRSLVLLLILVLIPTVVLAAPTVGTFIGLGPHRKIKGHLSGSDWANDGGTMKFDAGPKDGNDVLATFCIDINHTVRAGDAYVYDAELTDWQLIYLVQNYPPELNGDATEMAARQAAVWYFSDGFEPLTPTTNAIANRAWVIIHEVNGMTEEDYEAIELPHLSLTPEHKYIAVPGTSQMYEVMLKQGQTPVSGKDVRITTDNGKLDDLNGTTSTSNLTVTTSVTGFATFKLLPPPGHTPVTTTLTATAKDMAFPAGAVYIHESGEDGQELILGENTIQDLSDEAKIHWEDPNAVVLSGLHGRTNRIAGIGATLLLGLGAAVILRPRKKPHRQL